MPEQIDRPVSRHSVAEAESMAPSQTGGAISFVAPAAPGVAPEAVPERLGRYRLLACLGDGGFGAVYRAFDEELCRDVALKLPARYGVRQAETFLSEARALARLDHPAIVPVYDFGRTEDGRCYVVSKLVEGTDLAARLQAGRPSHAEAVALVIRIALALQHAHERGLFHRDVKPSNILLDCDGQPYLADFGLALPESAVGRGPSLAGTPAYMSPEQARGEGHLVDARTDIYSLGVVFYELLTGRRPFRGDSVADMLEQIRTREVRPPRQLDRTIPKELDRICLKAVARRVADRYSTAADLAEDLRDWQRGTRVLAPPAPHVTRVIPRGLRSFDATDADFFLSLLPGPRDRDGVPEAIGFWKRRIEQADSDRPFRVGLLYGPSGSGKSSLLKAGLLPRLNETVTAIRIEAALTGTESRLVRALAAACPGVSPTLSLPEALAALRRRVADGRKVLIVLDQFEQWLHGHGTDLERLELTAALRQADGTHVQCLLAIRDDFWVAASRFFHALEVRMVEDENVQLVDQFDMAHARHVLGLFGSAYGCLPADSTEWTPEQTAFLDQATRALGQDGKVIGVRLSLFADLFKSRPWTPLSLREVGGAEGVGITFLEETFSARTAIPERRTLRNGAQACLAALLPEEGMTIKGRQRSLSELRQACGLQHDPQQFARLLEILDHELRLVTPADAATLPASDADRDQAGEGQYQLTHDYLVPPLREWLQRHRRSTWRGRAALLLEERTAQWCRARKPRYLPSAMEYLRIRFGVPRRRFSADQNALMRAAARRLGLRWGSALGAWLAILLLTVGAIVHERKASRQREIESRVETALQAKADGFAYALAALEPDRPQVLPLLRQRFHTEPAGSIERLHAACALAKFGEIDADFLLDAIAQASAGECRNLFDALAPFATQVRPMLRERAAHEADPEIKARLAAALLHLGDLSAAQMVLALGPDPHPRTAFIHGFREWHGDLAAFPGLLHAATGSAFRSAVCTALGNTDPATLPASQRRELIAVLRELYQDAADGGTHSAAAWALAQWGIDLPALPRSAQAAAGRRWFVNRHGMTLLEIPAGSFVMGEDNRLIPYSSQRPVTISRSFFLADREVSVNLFHEFMDDPSCPASEKPRAWSGEDREISPRGDCPVQNVSWIDAVQFCNWLSRREGRQPCYRRVELSAPADEGVHGGGHGRGDGSGGGRNHKAVAGNATTEQWTCDFTADGYRLPTDAEWEYAARAGTETVYSFGDEGALLPRYARFSDNSLLSTLPGGSLLPNGWGLFDVHGNVWEWCNDWYDVLPRAPVTDPRGPDRPRAPVDRDRRIDRGGDAAREHLDKENWKVCRGGGVATRSGGPRSAARAGENQAARHLNIGFRVVCNAPHERS